MPLCLCSRAVVHLDQPFVFFLRAAPSHYLFFLSQFLCARAFLAVSGLTPHLAHSKRYNAAPAAALQAPLLPDHSGSARDRGAL